jgi:uncharacterized protein (DUF169 family)
MESLIAKALELEFRPVALIWAERAPEGATRFKPGRWACVVNLFAHAAAHGRVGAFDRQTYGCWGGGVGLGFGNCYEDFPGGVVCFCRFLSTGNKDFDEGRAIGEGMKGPGWDRMADDFLYGERYLKNEETAHSFVDTLPMRNIPSDFVVVKPLEQADPDREDIKNVTLFVDPDRLSALVVLANYARPAVDNVIVPWAAGCQVLGIFAYRELEREQPRGLIGMTDISARESVRPILGKNVLSFTAPWPLFLEMESNIEGSFVDRETWRSLLGKKP